MCNASSVICTNVNATEFYDLLDRLAAGAGGAAINRLAVRACVGSIGRFDRVPKELRVCALEISKCGISYISDTVLTSLAADLIELRLMSNALSEMPALGVLGHLQMLNLNGNSVSSIFVFFFSNVFCVCFLVDNTR